MLYDKDADLGLLEGKTVAVIGFGSQGHAHSQNLRDSGVKVVVAEAPGSSAWDRAVAAGFEVLTANAAAAVADVIMMVVPDQTQKVVYETAVRDNLKEGDMLMFAHGFNIHYNQIVPPKGVDVTMVAPKGPGHLVRRVYTEGGGVPALCAVYQDATGQARARALAYAKGIGALRAGVIETTFKEETETDLFGEQAVLCGGCSELIRAGFETLVEAGYQPEVAYFECLHELKLIVDLIYAGGLTRMRESVSDTAEFGDYVSGSRVIGAESRAQMASILAGIRDGSFAGRWILENQAGRPYFRSKRLMERGHLLESVGRDLRKMISWIRQE